MRCVRTTPHAFKPHRRVPPHSGRLAKPPVIRSHSSEEAIAIARRMEAKGGRMFGAFWCSHCINQKETMGREVRGAGCRLQAAG